MIFDRAVSAREAKPFYSTQELHKFADTGNEHQFVEANGSLEPPDGMYIWLFSFRSREWVARSNVANIGLHVTPENTHPGQVITGVIASIGFQIFTCRWPTDRRLELNSPHIRDWLSATSLLWPNPSDRTITWPPVGGYLADDTLEALYDRWNDGIPLQRPR